MPATYTPISREKLEAFLAEKGFLPLVVGSEIVYIFHHLLRPELILKVWTTIPVRGTSTRGSGEDAMRVTLAWEGKTPWSPWGKEPAASFGIWKAKRIFRVGGEAAILDRLYERMREGYAKANEFLRIHRGKMP